MRGTLFRPPAAARGRARRREAGLTLVEVAIVLSIIGVVATLSFLGYQSQMNKSRIRIAEADLTALDALVTNHEVMNGALPAALTDLNSEYDLDPWGNPYQYSGAPLRTDGVNFVNSDFDLWSTGRDGVSSPALTAAQSLDDVVKAHDGAFIGLASKY